MIRSDIETLLREDAWMRRIARGLLRDPHDAEDAVQDAWLADLEGAAPAKAERRRGWLRGVLWNRASARTRTERRLRERAEDAARGAPAPEAPPAGHDAEARDLRRAIAEAVLELDEPLRETVHLTYFAGLSLAEVAARTDVSKTAAHKRLDRALGELRRRLDAQHGGDRRAWSLGLATFLGADAPPLAAAASPPNPEPRLAMRQPELLAAAAVVVTAVASFSFLRGSPGPVAPLPGRVADADSPAEVAATTPASSRAATSPPPVAAAQSSEAEAALRGRFLLPDGSPAAGATWKLTGRRDSNRAALHDPSLDWSDRDGALDADGTLDVAFVPPPDHSIRLSVELEGHAPEVWDWWTVRRGSEVDVGRSVLRAEASIEGRLVDSDGETVVDRDWHVIARTGSRSYGGARVVPTARVSGESVPAVFLLEGLAPGSYVLDGGATDAPFDDVVVELGAGEAASVELTVRDEPAPVPRKGTRVRLSFWPRNSPSHPGPEPHTVTAVAADGTALEVHAERASHMDYFIEDPGPAPITVRVDDPRFEPWSREDVVPGEKASVTLIGTSTVRLDVTGPGGVDIGPFRVRRKRADAGEGLRDAGDGEPMVSGDTVPELVAGAPYLFVIDNEDYHGEAVVEGLVAGGVTGLDVVVAPRIHAHGSVVTPHGSPVGFVDVSLVSPAEVDDSEESWVIGPETASSHPERMRVIQATTQADGDGRFTLDVPRAGTFLVVASNGEGVESWSEPIEVEADVAGLELTVPLGGCVTGQLRMPEWVDPREWQVFVDWGGRSTFLSIGARVAEIDADGRFTLRGQPRGAAKLMLASPGVFGTGSGVEAVLLREVEVVPSETVDLGTIDPAPFPAVARVLLSGVEDRAGDREIVLRRTDTSNSLPGRTHMAVTVAGNEAGSFRLRPGPWALTVEGDGWAAIQPHVFEAPPSGELDVPLAISLAEGTFQVSWGGEPLADHDVYVRSTDPSQERHSFAKFRTDSEGRLAIALDHGAIRISSTIVPAPGEHAASFEAFLSWPPAPGAAVELD